LVQLWVDLLQGRQRTLAQRGGGILHQRLTHRPSCGAGRRPHLTQFFDGLEAFLGRFALQRRYPGLEAVVRFRLRSRWRAGRFFLLRRRLLFSSRRLVFLGWFLFLRRLLFLRGFFLLGWRVLSPGRRRLLLLGGRVRFLGRGLFLHGRDRRLLFPG